MTIIKKNASSATENLSMNYKWLEKMMWTNYITDGWQKNTGLLGYSKGNKVDHFIENFCFNLDY